MILTPQISTSHNFWTELLWVPIGPIGELEVNANFIREMEHSEMCFGRSHIKLLGHPHHETFHLVVVGASHAA